MEVKISQINGQDVLYITDKTINLWDRRPIEHKEKKLDEGELLFCDFYANGYCKFGITVPKKEGAPYNPITHAHEDYTWSSRAWVINQELGLFNTEWELARSNVGIRNDEGYYLDAGVLYSKAIKIAEDNQDKLEFGLEEFKRKNKCYPDNEDYYGEEDNPC